MSVSSQGGSIDPYTNEVLQRWLVQASVSLPSVTVESTLKAAANDVTEMMFSYRNASKDTRIIEFYSSQPERLHLLLSEEKLLPNQCLDIPVLIHSYDDMKQAVVFVFAMDKHKALLDVLRFTILYSA